MLASVDCIIGLIDILPTSSEFALKKFSTIKTEEFLQNMKSLINTVAFNLSKVQHFLNYYKSTS